MKWITSAELPPPNNRSGYMPDHWVRCNDPWHRDAFPAGQGDYAPVQSYTRASGWMGESWCGNPEQFVPDGTEVTNGY